MDMQDKEFDELFRSKLEDLEAVPSANVWPDIASVLNRGKKKKNLLPFLSVAASIIVIIGAGLWLIPKKPSVKNHAPVKNTVAKTIPRIKNKPTVIEHQQLVSPLKAAIVYNLAGTKAKQVKNTIDSPADTATTMLKNKGQQISVVSSLPETVPDLKAVVPDESIPLVIKQVAEQPLAYSGVSKNDENLIPAIHNGTPPVKTTHRIHSLGDLVNTLVATVDKRKDKVIEFTADDDGESRITGINLGIIKIKKGQ